MKASFFNPSCPICVPNQPPQQNSDGTWQTTPATQAWRAIPIPAEKIALNDQAAVALHMAGSVQQYYEMVDTQWPTDPTAAPSKPEGGLPNAVENKPGGNPTPVFLTNITMETYFQVGVQPACQQEENVSCPPSAWLTANQAHGRVSDTTSIFASESCMGCHSSAGLYTTYNPQTGTSTTSGQPKGDFSWLFTQKARWNPK